MDLNAISIQLGLSHVVFTVHTYAAPVYVCLYVCACIDIDDIDDVDI